MTTHDRFVAGVAMGAIGGTKAALLMAVPIGVASIDKGLQAAFKARFGFGTGAGSIAVLGIASAGLGALVGGGAAVITKDKTYGGIAGAAAGAATIGGIRALMTKSWQGAVAGALLGGVTGYLAGTAGSAAVR